MNPASIDYRPLTEPVAPGAVTAFRSWARSTRQPWLRASGSSQAAVVIFTVLAGVIAVAVVTTAVSIMLVAAAALGWAVLAVAVPALLLLGAGMLLAVFLVRRAAPFGGWERRYRLFHFAQANGMEWYPQIADPGYPGLLFDRGSARAAYAGARASSGRALDIGNYTYTTGSGDDRTVHRWGFLALRLDRRIPHCVVDARANNALFGASNLGSFARGQVLRLEGDFNEHFTLYCPRGYEADALYIFTPDLMALLIDHSSAFDVEIVDDWMFVYSPTPWNTLDPAAWARLFAIADTVGRKAVSQT
ncbi:hypothetical protein, partial [Microterricola pindariensis]